MSTRMLIDARHSEETRVTVVKGSRVEEFDYESATKKQLKGNIYLARVTRVEPSLQAAFVEYGGNRHGFLAFSEIHPDYYQIPVEDRDALLAAEAAVVESQDDAEEQAAPAPRSRSRRRRPRKTAAEKTTDMDASVSEEVSADASADTETATEQLSEASASEEDVTALQDASEESEELVSELKDSDEEDKDDAIEEVANRRRNLRDMKRRYSIQEVIKRRQVLLIQVVKEERGNKGAALTTYLSLAGRYCVLMPNSTHSGGISRKISSMADRKTLKQIITSLDVPQGMGLIVRTAGLQRTKVEIKRDYEYLLRLWNGIRELTLKSTAPALVYEEGDLIKRTIRDLYIRDIDEILVEGEEGYRVAKDFMKLLMPSHAKKVQHYKDNIPLFHRYQVESQLEAMYQPVVQLKSGGYIVINPTEALISIDVNSGRATKEHNIEETAYKTNLEASDEVARQLRLRDMAGLVVIDFIDMEDRGNNRAVERRMKDVLKSDRARIQVGRISSFGLMEMSRQRLRPNLLEVAMETCSNCSGMGIVRSVESAALMALRQLEEEGIRARSSVIRVNANPNVAIYLLNKKRLLLSELEQRYNLVIEVLANPALGQSDIEITREIGNAPAVAQNAVAEGVVEKALTLESVPDATPVKQPEEGETENAAVAGEEQPRRKRRRRRRRRRGSSDETNTLSENNAPSTEASAEVNENSEAPSEDATATTASDAEVSDDEQPRPRRRRGSRGGRRRRTKTDETQTEASAEPTETEEAQNAVTASEENASPSVETSDTPTASTDVSDAEASPPRRRRRVRKPATSTTEAVATEETSGAKAETVEQQPAVSEPEVQQAAPAEEKPKRRTRKKAAVKTEAEEGTQEVEGTEAAPAEKKKPVRRSRAKAKPAADATEAKAEESMEKPAAKPRVRRSRAKKPAVAEAVETAPAVKAETPETSSPAPAAAAPAPAPKPEKVDAPAPKAAPAAETAKPQDSTPEASSEESVPRKKGWWQRTFG